MPCNNCGNDLPIENKKYGLCANCNSLRLHNGKSISERKKEQNLRYIERAKERFRSKVSSENDSFDWSRRSLQTSKAETKKKTPLKQQTSKESIIKGKLSQIKQKIRLEAVQNNEYFCKGCGSGQVDLDVSHILSVGQYKHLELIEENMQLLCRGCHIDWESNDIALMIELNCFEENLVLISKYDQIKYNKLLTKLDDYQRRGF